MTMRWSLIKPRLAHARDQVWAEGDRIRYPRVFRSILSHSDAAEMIRDRLLAPTPLAIARMGRTEGRILGEWKFRRSRYSSKSYYQAHRYSGVFPVNPDLLDAFAGCYGAALSELDLLAFWPTEFQAKLVARLESRPHLVDRLDLEPFLSPNPWSIALAGRRVLVVHPFRETILSQYENQRANLFADPRVLPGFELQVIPAPQCAGGRTEGFANWFEAYHSLEEKVLAADFDVAIIGCGAFGLPLAAAIKRSGAKAIHMGGVTQVLFGVTGRRWLDVPMYQHLFNEYWTRPTGTDVVQGREQVDSACYW